ncbi:MAG: dual OB domain-containing protein [Bryobacteraceae bacterium]
MRLDLLIVSVSRQADGRSIIGHGAASPGNYGFVRLVAPTPGGVLYPERHRIQNVVEPRPFDLIRVEAPWADSRPAQPENRIVDDTAWELLERPASREHMDRLERSAVSGGLLFGTPGRSVRAGGSEPAASILYVDPRDTEAVCDWDGAREKFRARLCFTSGRTAYNLPLTDAHFSQVLRGMGEGVYRLDQLGCRAPHGLRLLVTLGEPFHGWRYKMVSSILPRRTVTLWRDAAPPPISPAIRYPAERPVELPSAFVADA